MSNIDKTVTVNGITHTRRLLRGWKNQNKWLFTPRPSKMYVVVNHAQKEMFEFDSFVEAVMFSREYTGGFVAVTRAGDLFSCDYLFNGTRKWGELGPNKNNAPAQYVRTGYSETYARHAGLTNRSHLPK